MRDALARSIHFIVWTNFVRADVYLEWAAAMMLLAVVVCVVMSTGRLFDGNEPPASATDTLVMGIAVGIAVWTPVLFVTAALHAYRPTVIATLAAVAIAAPAIWRRSIAELATPWRRIGAALREERWLWVVFALCSLSALLPPYRWDETAYHLAQADQWVRAGGLTVDPYLRYPLNPCNWQLVQGVALMLGSTTLVHLLTWLTGCLSALVVLLMLRQIGVRDAVAYPAAIAFFVTPLVQELLTTGLIDVPLMFWLTVAVYALFRLRGTDSPRMRRGLGAALCAGMFTGMKITGVLFLPLFVALAHYRLRRPARLAYLVALLATAAPWYVRNAVLSGDPVPPVMGRALNTPSLYWSNWDRDAQAADLHAGLRWTPAALAALPFQTLRSTDNGQLRGWPLLGYVLVFPLSALLARRLWRQVSIEPLAGAWYAATVWIATTYHVRYAIFLPLAVIVAAVTLDTLVHTVPRWGAALASIVLLIGPTPAAARYIKNDWAQPIPSRGQSEGRGPCEFEVMRGLAGGVDHPTRLYLVNLSPLKFDLQRRGYRAIGDDFHDGRWTDFWRAVDEHRPGAFLQSLPADYAVLCRVDPPTREAQWRTTIEALAADPALATVTADSVTAIFRITR